MSKKVVIVGAGISGLTTAFKLKQAGAEVDIYEEKPCAGGSVETIRDQDYLIDFGPNSGLETTPLIREMVDQLGIGDQMVYANKEGNNRYILKNGQLKALPTSPGAFLKTDLFSLKAKLRLCMEPFVGKSQDGYNQSLGEFVIRRLGQEFLDYAIDPFVSGVYAGDPFKLSVKSAFPKLYRLEEVYGGLIKGAILGARERKKRAEVAKDHAKMFSFKNGMSTFTSALASALKDEIKYRHLLTLVRKVDGKYLLTFDRDGLQTEVSADAVFLTIPAYNASIVLQDLDELAARHLQSIFYPQVMVMYVAFPKKGIQRKLDGFGFLIPSKEKRSFLGAIWSSTIFGNRAPEDHAAFTIFVGGAKVPQMFDDKPEYVAKKALKEFKQVMGIESEPSVLKFKLWKKAIPQYNIGYQAHEEYFTQFEKSNPGLFLGGNYRGGISVGDCVKNSEPNATRIFEYLHNNEA